MNTPGNNAPLSATPKGVEANLAATTVGGKKSLFTCSVGVVSLNPRLIALIPPRMFGGVHREVHREYLFQGDRTNIARRHFRIAELESKLEWDKPCDKSQDKLETFAIE